MDTDLRISILVDNPNSWMVPCAQDIQKKLGVRYKTKLFFEPSLIPCGNILFLLGCTSLLSNEILQKNEYTFVVHESDLPEGKGWSPLAWQVLSGKNSIPIVLFAADENVDAGPIYLKDTIELDGTELLPEIKQKQGEKTAALVYKLMNKWPNIKGKPQAGEPTYYRRRSKEDDVLDIEKSIKENFNHLRIVDNERYPAWFIHAGQKYIMKIYKAHSR